MVDYSIVFCMFTRGYLKWPLIKWGHPQKISHGDDWESPILRALHIMGIKWMYDFYDAFIFLTTHIFGKLIKSPDLNWLLGWRLSFRSFPLHPITILSYGISNRGSYPSGWRCVFATRDPNSCSFSLLRVSCMNPLLFCCWNHRVYRYWNRSFPQFVLQRWLSLRMLSA